MRGRSGGTGTSPDRRTDRGIVSGREGPLFGRRMAAPREAALLSRRAKPTVPQLPGADLMPRTGTALWAYPSQPAAGPLPLKMPRAALLPGHKVCLRLLWNCRLGPAAE